MIEIRREQSGDSVAVHNINELAFGQPTEAILVDTLRTACPDALSLVATMDDQVVGHILFTPVTVVVPQGEIKGLGLAPMSVTPEFQRRGTGSQLVRVIFPYRPISRT